MLNLTDTLPEHIQNVLNRAECIYTKSQVDAALETMALAINVKLKNSNPIFLCVMIGGLIPAGNLLPYINLPLELDYIHATRYRGAICGGEIHWKVTPSAKLTDRTVLIIDDILDGGITLKAIVDYCYAAGAKNVQTAVLVDKQNSRDPGGLPQADFTGLYVENHYIFGYGMDYKEYLRNVPGIYRVIT